MFLEDIANGSDPKIIIIGSRRVNASQSSILSLIYDRQTALFLIFSEM